MEEKGFEKSRRDRAQHLGGKRPGQGSVRVERGRVPVCAAHERVLWAGKLVWKQMAEKLELL